MEAERLIKELKRSSLYAECPACGGNFKLSEAVLFDGTKSFPKIALSIQADMQEEFKERVEDLKKREKLVTEKVAITAKAVNIGKNLEKILPTLKEFRWELSDSRFLGDPIDLITFNGLSQGKVNSIDFIEVKSGDARLNNHQKLIKEAVEGRKISYEVFG